MVNLASQNVAIAMQSLRFQIANSKSQLSPQVPQKNRGMKSQIAAFRNRKFQIAMFF